MLGKPNTSSKEKNERQDPMKNKRVLITGATNGIGKAAALEIAKQGATVILVGRDKAKTESVVNELRGASGNQHIEFLLADLSSQGDIHKLAADFKAKHSRLDVLINNAGGYFDERNTTVDGLEYTFAFNHLGYFLLTNLLLDVLKASSPSRIINVSSGAQALGKIAWDDLQLSKNYGGMKAYYQSKLANVMFTYELAKRLTNTGVTVNALHPGVVNSGFGSGVGGFVGFVFGLIKRFQAISPEQGADTVVYLATSPEVEGVTGKYFDKRKEKKTNPLSYDDAANKRLWEESAKLVQIAS
jgi:NAD(P)-dependent dehydrogenase (short-subunit alcohol dehydrogenase family)